MTTGAARVIMAAAVHGLGESGRAWADAMCAEFEEAAEDGRALPFAAGCLLTAWRGLPTHEEGRFTLASHLLAVGCIVPVATVLMAGVIGPAEMSAMINGPIAGRVPAGLVNEANVAALPLLALLVLMLAAAKLRLAWLVLDRDWARVAAGAAASAAVTATLIVFTFALFLNLAGALVQAAVLAGELAAIASLAQWHARLPVARP